MESEKSKGKGIKSGFEFSQKCHMVLHFIYREGALYWEQVELGHTTLETFFMSMTSYWSISITYHIDALETRQ